jgi:hypothetical protein
MVNASANGNQTEEKGGQNVKGNEITRKRRACRKQLHVSSAACTLGHLIDWKHSRTACPFIQVDTQVSIVMAKVFLDSVFPWVFLQYLVLFRAVFYYGCRALILT